MARFTGRQYKGAARDARALRRVEAEKRNEVTPPERHKSTRRALAAEKIAAAVAERRNRSRRGKRAFVRSTPALIIPGTVKRHANGGVDFETK